MRRTFLTIAALTLAACAGDGAPASTVPPGSTTTTAAATSTTAPAATTTSEGATTTTGGSNADAKITIAGFAYGPPLTVPVGSIVEVVNEDSVPHTWTSTNGVFDSGTLSGGEVFRFTFDEAGEYQFFCGIHPQMTGSITVEG